MTNRASVETMVDHLFWLKGVLGQTASEIVAWFIWPWSLFPWLAIGGAVALGLARRAGLLAFYLGGFFYLWGAGIVAGEMNIQDTAGWIHFGLYFALGVVCAFALYHGIYVRGQQSSAFRRQAGEGYRDIGERGAAALGARQRRDRER